MHIFTCLRPFSVLLHLSSFWLDWVNVVSRRFLIISLVVGFKDMNYIFSMSGFMRKKMFGLHIYHAGKLDTEFSERLVV